VSVGGNRKNVRMRVIDTGVELREAVAGARAVGKRIGFVPTMGALHEGHLSLVRRAREENDFLVISIFVNTTQFGPNEDLDSYPRDLEGDTAKSREIGVDVIFAPTAAEMYPEGFSTRICQTGLADVLEGAHRPGHFDGVCTVCAKLFNLVQAGKAYFGRKDYQQSLIVRRMVRDLDFPLEIRVLPTVREEDGLAMSSRNQYLNPEERRQAPSLYRALKRAREAFHAGERKASTLRGMMEEEIRQAPLAKIDYVAIADAESLASLDTIETDAVALLAVRIGGTRLIDNMPLPMHT